MTPGSTARRDLERRNRFREIRRTILELDPQTDLRTFLTGVIRPLVAGTGASAGGVVMHFSETTRDVLFLVTSAGEVGRRVRPMDEIERLTVPESLAGKFATPDLNELAGEMELPVDRVEAIPILVNGASVAAIELVDPDPAYVPDASTLAADLAEVAAAFELAFLYSRLRRERLEARLLNTVSQELGRTLDVSALLNVILDLLRQVVPYDAAAIFLLAESGLDVVDQSVRGYGDVDDNTLHLKVGQGIVGWSAKTGHPQIVPDVQADSRYRMARDGTRSEMVTPLRSGGKTLGVFNLESDRPNAYTPHDLDLLVTFAGQAAVALERARLLLEREEARRLAQEVQIARRIQRFFLPRVGMELQERGFSGRTIPSLEVSGDYFDIIEGEGGVVSLTVSDVSGKGIPAALIMSSLRAAFHIEVSRGDDPAGWCANLNHLLVEALRETEFVTGVFGRIEGTRFRYCNAGHNPPLLMRADGSVTWLDTGGTILGAFREAVYEAGEVEIRPGDRLVLYTDGVTEAAPDPDAEQYETERLVAVVRQNLERSAAQLTAAIVRDVRGYVHGSLPDDLTVLAVAPAGITTG